MGFGCAEVDTRSVRSFERSARRRVIRRLAIQSIQPDRCDLDDFSPARVLGLHLVEQFPRGTWKRLRPLGEQAL